MTQLAIRVGVIDGVVSTNASLRLRRILEHLGLPTTAPTLAPARSPPELEFAG